MKLKITIASMAVLLMGMGSIYSILMLADIFPYLLSRTASLSTIEKAGYYLVVSMTEESIKAIMALIFFGVLRFKKFTLIESAILSAMTFSLVENGYYAIMRDEPSILITRMLFSTPIHLICTVALFSFISERNLRQFIIGFAVAVAIHTSYNLGIATGYSIVSLSIWGFGVMYLQTKFLSIHLGLLKHQMVG